MSFKTFISLSLLGSSNSRVQMWGFQPLVDMHAALWLERQRCKWHLILLGDSPKIIFSHAFYFFSLKEDLWSQPKSCHTLPCKRILSSLDSDSEPSSKKKAPWPLEGTCWWFSIMMDPGLVYCPSPARKGWIWKRGGWHDVLTPSALNTLVNVIDLDSAGEDLEFICLQYFPVATEMHSPRSLF